MFAARRRACAILVEEAWAVGIIDHPLPALLDLPEPLPVRWLLHPDSYHYMADPFGMPGDGSRLFCERFTHADGKGRLVEVTLGAPSAIRPLDFGLPGHLSYPFLAANDGRLYCLPESAEARRLVLFAQSPGGGWRQAAVLLDGVAAADATLFGWDGLWWLAWSDVDVGACDTLFLAWAERPEGPWHRHPANPVKRNAASARPAGTPFVRDGVLFRPAQDCSHTYGGAVVVNRVLRLDPHGFAEIPERRFGPVPGPYPHGLHTLSAWGERTLVDAKRHCLNPVALRRKLLRRLEPLTRRRKP